MKSPITNRCMKRCSTSLVIREKIEKDTSAPKILITKRGIGYYIATGKEN